MKERKQGRGEGRRGTVHDRSRLGVEHGARPEASRQRLDGAAPPVPPSRLSPLASGGHGGAGRAAARRDRAVPPRAPLVEAPGGRSERLLRKMWM